MNNEQNLRTGCELFELELPLHRIHAAFGRAHNVSILTLQFRQGNHGCAVNRRSLLVDDNSRERQPRRQCERYWLIPVVGCIFILMLAVSAYWEPDIRGFISFKL